MSAGLDQPDPPDSEDEVNPLCEHLGHDWQPTTRTWSRPERPASTFRLCERCGDIGWEMPR